LTSPGNILSNQYIHEGFNGTFHVVDGRTSVEAKGALLDQRLLDVWKKTARRTSRQGRNSGVVFVEASRTVFTESLHETGKNSAGIEAAVVRVMTASIEAAGTCHMDPLVALHHAVRGIISGSFDAGVDLSRTASIALRAAAKLMSQRGMDGSSAEREVAAAIIIGSLDISMEAAVCARRAVRRILSDRS
jgi:hypothetical protein